jgi:hypothetical protein
MWRQAVALSQWPDRSIIAGAPVALPAIRQQRFTTGAFHSICNRRSDEPARPPLQIVSGQARDMPLKKHLASCGRWIRYSLKVS